MTNEWHQPMNQDLADGSPEIHWPEKFNPDTADLFAHNERTIHASAKRIWECLIDVKKWPTWYPNSADVQFEGLLASDSIFTWNTFGLPIESKINEYVPGSRLSWYGGAPGTQPAFYHTWLIVPQGDNTCQVITEEVGIGANAASFRKNNEGLLHRGHDLWLAGLAWAAEDGQA